MLHAVKLHEKLTISSWSIFWLNNSGTNGLLTVLYYIHVYWISMTTINILKILLILYERVGQCRRADKRLAIQVHLFSIREFEKINQK